MRVLCLKWTQINENEVPSQDQSFSFHYFDPPNRPPNGPPLAPFGVSICTSFEIPFRSFSAPIWVTKKYEISRFPSFLNLGSLSSSFRRSFLVRFGSVFGGLFGLAFAPVSGAFFGPFDPSLLSPFWTPFRVPKNHRKRHTSNVLRPFRSRFGIRPWAPFWSLLSARFRNSVFNSVWAHLGGGLFGSFSGTRRATFGPI